MMTKLEIAARQALEALEELFHSNSTKVAVEKYNIAHTALQEALSDQADQEPVAWFVQYKNRHEFVFGSKPEFIVDGVVEPLYAAPVSIEAAVLAEREACAKESLEVLESLREETISQCQKGMVEAYKLGQSEEREECAKVCDRVGYHHEVQQGAELAFDLAAAIRARGNQ